MDITVYFINGLGVCLDIWSQKLLKLSPLREAIEGNKLYCCDIDSQGSKPIPNEDYWPIFSAIPSTYVLARYWAIK